MQIDIFLTHIAKDLTKFILGDAKGKEGNSVRVIRIKGEHCQDVYLEEFDFISSGYFFSKDLTRKN